MVSADEGGAVNAVEWPKLNPAWGRLVEQAWRTLEALREKDSDGNFHATRSESDGYGPSADISSLLAIEAILDLQDRAPEWARNIKWTKDLYASLRSTKQMALLRSAKKEIGLESEEEIDGLESEVKRLAKEVESAVGAKPLARLVPVATATLVSTLTRAQLLLNLEKRPSQAGTLKTDPKVLATLVLQSMALRTCESVTDMWVHPYALYQVRRSLWLADMVFDGKPKMREAIRSERDKLGTKTIELTERLLARSQIGGVRDGENVALVFCAATLALGPPAPAHVIEALSAAADGQSPRGDWPQGRRIGQHLDPDTGDQLVISTHEVALAFAEAIMWLGQVPGASSRLNPSAISALQLAVDYLREGRVDFKAEVDALGDADSAAMVGWSSTNVYGPIRIDVKATAAALRLTIATRAIAEQVRSVGALEEFEEVWDPAIDHTPPFLEWKTYMEESEPDSENPILEFLDEKFVQRAKKRKNIDSRPWARAEAMSVILFGPPGTTKTTIVKAMAQGLKWPLVTLSPGTFIRDGLENVERRAIEVFSHLKDLQRVVVLFDECDELFRKRRGSAESTAKDEARSISAFMTASMLPKLQDLRDNGQIFFVIATNYFDQIDPAAKRIGRIDRVVGVGWPDEVQRKRIIQQTLKNELSKKVATSPRTVEASDALARVTRFYVRGELVELANELAEELLDKGTKRKSPEVLAKAVKKGMPYSIEKAEREEFWKEAKARSACHEEDKGEMIEEPV